MADWKIAFDWMMAFEDAHRLCRAIPDAAPQGHSEPCFAISGINSAVFPREYALIAALPEAERAAAVRQFYERHFWNPWFARLASDELCKRVFDFAINAGAGTAVRLLQKAANGLRRSYAEPVAEDGVWGEKTLAVVNAANADALVAAFKAHRADFYRSIAAASPAKQKYLKGWLERASR